MAVSPRAMPKRRQLRGFDLKQIEGVAELIGVDEAGRGALAGPVVAGAVLVTKDFLEGRWAVAKAGRVNDSKQLSAAEREELWGEFETLVAQGRIHAQFGVADVDEIERLNILGATKLAMRRRVQLADGSVCHRHGRHGQDGDSLGHDHERVRPGHGELRHHAGQ